MLGKLLLESLFAYAFGSSTGQTLDLISPVVRHAE